MRKSRTDLPGKSAEETLAIPQSVREAVDARDGRTCRVCGKHLGDERALHHVLFGGTAVGMGGRRRHAVDEIITVCWFWPGNCHDLVHANKPKYQALLLELAQGLHAGTTAQQLLRWRAKGSGGQPFTLEDIRERFYRSLKPGPNGCLLWTGPTSEQGYGVLNYKALLGRPVGAHRVAWLFAHGAWPNGDLLHSCDTPACCELTHLRVGTQTENMQDRKERNPRWGTANPRSKHGSLVQEIRDRVDAGESQASVARSLHLDSGVVSRIFRGINYPLASTAPAADET